VEVVIALDDAASAAMHEIRTRTGMDDSNVLSRALNIMQWAVKQRREKRIVASVDESAHTYRELDLDAALAQPQATQASPNEDGVAA
jgi:hypothetical protein